MAQPQWKRIANLGDASLDSGNVDFGGYLIYTDETGVYPAEAEFIVEPPDYQWSDDGWDAEARWTVYRFILERCTYINGVLSDNRFHPELPAWFADSLPNVAQSISAIYPNGADDATGSTIIQALCSDNPLERAHGWREIGEYHGFNELDDSPLSLTQAEAEARYKIERNEA